MSTYHRLIKIGVRNCEVTMTDEPKGKWYQELWWRIAGLFIVPYMIWKYGLHDAANIMEKRARDARREYDDMMKLPYPEDCHFFNSCSKAGDGMCPQDCGAYRECTCRMPPLDEKDPFDKVKP